MGRKRNIDTGAKGADPTCPAAHPLRRRVADGDYECDVCNATVEGGCCFYGCEPCDYALCGGCYVKLATGSLPEGATPGAIPPPPELPGVVDPDVADLCEHYEVEDRVMQILNDAMKERRETFDTDILGLWESLQTARSPAGLLMAKIRMMKDGTFVGKVAPPPEVKRVIDKYRLDMDARTKLTDFILKRPETSTADLWEVERRLENSGKPSAVVMTMIVALQKGTRLPEMRTAAPHRDYGELGKTGKGKGEESALAKDSKDLNERMKESSRKDKSRSRKKSRSRDRDRDRKRSRSRKKSRSRSRKKSRSRSRKKRSRS